MRSMANDQPLTPFQEVHEKIKKAREELSLKIVREIRSDGALPTHVSTPIASSRTPGCYERTGLAKFLMIQGSQRLMKSPNQAITV